MSSSQATNGMTEEIVSSHIPKVELFEATPGARVDGRFELIKKIGEGGMGVVYLAKQINIGRDVVIKLLKPHLCSNEEQVNRFRREASLAGRLSHPNCVTIHDFGFFKGTPYIVMEYLEGSPLVDLLYHRGRLSPREVIQILSQTCDALEAARGLEVVHRDLKPENIFILKEAVGAVNVKVLDFGIAKLAHTHPEASDSNLTRGDMIFGTPQYMSPEQIRGKPIDHRADVYALTVIFYEMIVGSLPFDQDDPADVVSILTQHLRDPIPFLNAEQVDPQLVSSINEINHVLARGMAKSAEERISCADELKTALENLWDRAQLATHETPEPTLTPPSGARRMTRSSLLLSPLVQSDSIAHTGGLQVEDLLPRVSDSPSRDAEQTPNDSPRESHLMRPSPTLSSPDISSLSPQAEGTQPSVSGRSSQNERGLVRTLAKLLIWLCLLSFSLGIAMTYPRSPLAGGELRALIAPYLSEETNQRLKRGEAWLRERLSPAYQWVDERLSLEPVTTPPKAQLPLEGPSGQPTHDLQLNPEAHRDSDPNAPATPSAPAGSSEDSSPRDPAQGERGSLERLDSSSPTKVKRAPRWLRVVRDTVTDRDQEDAVERAEKLLDASVSLTRGE